MKVHFYIRYRTQYGESLLVSGNCPELGNDHPDRALALEYLHDDLWHGAAELGKKMPATLTYRYHHCDSAGQVQTEWDKDRHLQLAEFDGSDLHCYDAWNPPAALENTFLTQPFREIFLKRPIADATAKKSAFTHVFRVKAPLLDTDQVVCLLGHGNTLRNWDSTAPLLLQPEGNWWTIRLDLSPEHFPLAYKYGIWNTKTRKFEGFEAGSNRALFVHLQGEKVLHHDGFAQFPPRQWRGAGVAIPVFSLRSAGSFGVGEFTDLHLLADWAKSTGLKLLQLLPVNDTTATHTWTDSYPYAAISAFALHPIYLNVAAMAGKKHAALLKPFSKKQKELNALPAVDYEAVMQAKWEMIHLVYAADKETFFKDKNWQLYLAQNAHWLKPYAAFCYLRDLNGTADFNAWQTHHSYDPKSIEPLFEPDAKHFDAVAIHLYVQWHLHLQLKAAADYAHSQGLAMKGDIPIGIYRFSCDAWMAPELYNMDKQAGAPPDDFAEKGQNWGFPTYNWARMKQDGFAWWRQRFEQMSLYFDAFRIDHILGFFRIWSIPLDAVEGILGSFVPALPVQERELQEAGIGFSRDRLCKPYITDAVLEEMFGAAAPEVLQQFLRKTSDAGHWSGGSQYTFKPQFNTQRKVESWFEGQEPTEQNQTLRDNLYDLHANVILLDTDDTPQKGDWSGAFRFGMEKTSSYRHLDDYVKEKLQALYVDYFYRRQDAFWQEQAMEKLPALKRSTDMLICGEDLGMVPHCVPDVMDSMAILSLEIQRMPKKSGFAFFHPKDAPYLSVVTPSTHDMSTLRGWWEEDRNLTRRFFNEVLGYHGEAPFFCEPWINRVLLEQHLHAPAMWSIFQLQDLLGMDGALRRENPHEERINVPANPKHYWRYRMHLSLEALQQSEGFNTTLKKMVEESRR